MKKIISLIAIVFLTSCSPYRPASLASSKSYIGMTIEEFKKIAGKEITLEAMELGYTVYRINDYADKSKTVTTDTKFYYFDSTAKLVKIDGGEFKQKRYQVEIINH